MLGIGAGAQPVDLERLVAGRRGRRGVERLAGRARSSAGSCGRGAISPRASSPTTRAVAQHDDAVGAVLDLVQAMRDEDDADAVRLELGDDVEQPVGLGER